jgi:hypothetical protein
MEIPKTTFCLRQLASEVETTIARDLHYGRGEFLSNDDAPRPTHPEYQIEESRPCPFGTVQMACHRGMCSAEFCAHYSRRLSWGAFDFGLIS